MHASYGISDSISSKMGGFVTWALTSICLALISKQKRGHRKICPKNMLPMTFLLQLDPTTFYHFPIIPYYKFIKASTG